MSAAPVASAQAAAPVAKAIPPKAFVAASLGFVALTAVVLGSVYTPLLSLVFAPAPPAVEPVSDSKIKVREHEFADRLASAGDKVIKRSPFHPPVVKEDPEPPVPKTYGGPTIIGVAGGAVYFNDYSAPSSVKRVNLGETDGDVTVIKIDAPWSVTLGWKGGEFVVPMLDRQPVKFDANTTVKDMLFQTTPAAAEPERQRDRPRRSSRN
ncbi:MAG: hypothetical protein QM783_15655 [Phycisphaerales bacterium]